MFSKDRRCRIAPTGRAAPLYGVELASVHERTPEVHLHVSPLDVHGDLVGGGPGTLCFPFLPTSPQTSQ